MAVAVGDVFLMREDFNAPDVGRSFVLVDLFFEVRPVLCKVATGSFDAATLTFTPDRPVRLYYISGWPTHVMVGQMPAEEAAALLKEPKR